MKITLPVLIACLGFTASSFAAPLKCEGQEGSAMLSACRLFNEFEEADQELNSLYRVVLASYKEKGANEQRARLISAQRAWVQFKEASCKFEQEYVGGAWNINQKECLLNMTKERIEYLRLYQ